MHKDSRNQSKLAKSFAWAWPEILTRGTIKCITDTVLLKIAILTNQGFQNVALTS